MAERVLAAVLGPGNIGTDLLVKLTRSALVEPVLMAGIYADSPGLARARELGVATSDRGLDGVLDSAAEIVFDATSAAAHRESGPRLVADGRQVVDLTPAALGPYVVPAVNLDDHLDAPNLNMVTCGGQATIPIVHAIARVAPVAYAEIVATIASAGAGPGTRQNIDEFTQTTARAIRTVGGAADAKAIILLNPAEPPILMRDTVYASVAPDADAQAIQRSVKAMVAELRAYVPGCEPRLCDIRDGLVTVAIQIEGAGDFLPAYSGNLDIMTAAAARVGDRLAAGRRDRRHASAGEVVR